MSEQINNNSGAAVPFAEDDENSALSLDAVLTILRRFWFLILLFALIGGAAGYYYGGRLHYTYSKTASVMMRDKGAKDSSERILSELGADPGAASLANESLILKSTELMSRVIEKLRLDVTYWTPDKLREVELYNTSPLLATFDHIDENRYVQLTIIPRDNNSYELLYTNSVGVEQSITGEYSKSIDLPFCSVAVHPSAYMSEGWIGKKVYVKRSSVLAAARELLSALVVTRPDKSEASMLQLTITATHPKKAEDVLNTLIDVYNEKSKDEKSAAARKTEIFIRERLAEIGRALENVDKQISESKADAKILTDTQSAITSDLGSTQALEKAITDMETQIKLSGVLREQLTDAAQEEGLISVGVGISDEAISGKIEAYNEAYLDWKRLSGSAGAKNPLAVAHREKMTASLSAAKSALDNYISNLHIQLRELETQKAELERRLAATVGKEQELTPLLREHKVREELYMLLLTKEQENALSLAITEPIANVLETAHGSDAPVAPRANMFTAAGAVGGGAACLLLILGIGMLNNKVKNRHDVTANSSLPVLAELPELTRRERRAKGLFIQDPHSTMAEGLHILRNNVDNFLPRPDGSGHIILFTSSMPNEGKTFVAANLAATFAQTGRKVLLIDADLRKRSLTRDLGGKGRNGLTTYLLHRESELSKLIHNLPQAVPAAKNEETARKHDGRADILYAGPSVPHPITLLAQPLLGEMLKSLAKEYDAIIVDAPPCGILADTDILAAQCDITLYLVRSGLIDKRYLQQVQKMADQGKLPHVAYVINAVDFKASSYNYYGYTYGHYRYGYGNK